MNPVFRLAVTAITVGIAAGCASSSATPTQREMTAYIPGAAMGAFSISPDNGAIVANISAPLAQVWLRLPKAFDTLGVPLSVIDPRRHIIGNEGVKLRAKLGTQRLSTYLECGTTQVGPNADSYEVNFSILTQLDSVGPAMTRMTTTMNAAAKPLAFSQEYSRCTSKVVLEKRLLDVVATGVRK